MSSAALFESNLRSFPLLYRGKVRDNYAIGDDRLLIVASDRLSAFDVVLPDPIPGKGRVLTAISNFWFARTRHIVANHLTGEPVSNYVRDAAERAPLEGRAVVVRRLNPLPVEAVVRGYLIGFVKYSSAPSRITRSRPSSPVAVTMMTLTGAVDHRRGADLLDHRTLLVERQPGIERRAHQPGLGAAEIAGNRMEAVVDQQGDRTSLGEAEPAAQRIGDLVR